MIVLGAGSIGSAYGAILSRRNDVTLIGRAPHIESINSSGLVVEGDFAGTYQLNAETEMKNIGPNTLVIVSTKAFDLSESLRAIQPLLRQDTVIFLIQNGLGITGIAKKATKKHEKIIRGLTHMAAELIKPGQIHIWQGETVLPKDDISNRIAKSLEKCRMPVRMSKNFRLEIWKKLVMNAVINPLTALLQVRNNQIGTPILAGIRHAIIHEGVAVGQAEGVEISADLINYIDKAIACFPNRSSMLQDIIQRRRTEINFINGKIVELGQRHGIPTPVNECLLQLIRFLGGNRK